MMFDPRLGVRRASVAPHLRAPTSFARTQAFLLVALLPVLAASVYVTGWQYLQAVRSLHVIMDDWRADWILMPLFSGSDILFIVWAGLVHVAPVLGLAYGRLATVALAAAKIISAIGCFLILGSGLYHALVGYFRGEIVIVLFSLVGAVVAFLFQFAMFVVFARVADFERR